MSSTTKQDLSQAPIAAASASPPPLSTPLTSTGAISTQDADFLSHVFENSTSTSYQGHGGSSTEPPRDAQIQLEERLKLRHSGNILNMQACSQTDRLATLCDDKSLQIWDTSTAAEISRRVIPEAWPSVHTAFSEDLRWLVLSPPATNIFLYDLQSPSTERVSIGYVLGYPSGCVISPDCQRIATIHHDSSESFVNIWDTSGQSISRITIGNPAVFWISFLPARHGLVAVSKDGKVYSLDIRQPKPMRQRELGPAVEVSTAVLTRGGQQLNVVSHTMLVFVFLLDGDGKPMQQLKYSYSAPITSVARDSRRDLFAVLDRDGKIEIHEPFTNLEYSLYTCNIQTTLERPRLALSIGASWLAAETEEEIVTVFNLSIPSFHKQPVLMPVLGGTTFENGPSPTYRY